MNHAEYMAPGRRILHVLVRWERPEDFTSPYTITTTFVPASQEWSKAKPETNTFEREDYRELIETIYFYLGGDISIIPYEPLITDTALDNTIKKYTMFCVGPSWIPYATARGHAFGTAHGELHLPSEDATAESEQDNEHPQ